jgi:hypothetical protein
MKNLRLNQFRRWRHRLCRQNLRQYFRNRRRRRRESQKLQ